MKIVLLKDVLKVGRKGDLVNVSDGYAMNSLFPKKLAVLANTNEGKKILEEHRVELEKRNREKEKVVSYLKELAGKVFKVERKANEKRVLFDSFDIKDLNKLLDNQIKDHFIIEGLPIKTIGIHEVRIKSAQDKKEISKISIEI